MNSSIFSFKLFFVTAFLLLPMLGITQIVEEKETYIITTISKHTICAGNELLVNTKQVATLPPAPDITIFIQLSNAEGNFESFTNIGSSFNYLNISCIIPSWVQASDKYKIRMRAKSDSPNHYYVYPRTIAVIAAPPLYIIDGNTSVCAGSIHQYNIDLVKGDVPKWSVSNGTILDTLNNKASVKWNKDGVGILRVQALENSCGAAEIANLNVLIKTDGSCITSTMDGNSNEPYLLLINTGTDHTLEIKTNFGIQNISIHNYTGQLLGTSKSNFIDIEHLNIGMYLLEVEGTHGQRLVKKFYRE